VKSPESQGKLSYRPVSKAEELSAEFGSESAAFSSPTSDSLLRRSGFLRQNLLKLMSPLMHSDYLDQKSTLAL
jgi:hypothetical protein